MAVNNKIFIPTFISSINYEPVRTLPHIYFYNGLKSSEEYFIQHYPSGSTSSVSVDSQTAFPYFDYYDGLTPNSSSNSLLFFNETPPYGSTPTGSLYTEYWETYVSLLYNPRTRLFKASAIIPLADYFDMELNDIVQWRGNYYHLRAINDYNLKDGTCNIELLGPIIRDAYVQGVPQLDCTFNFSASVVTTTTTTTAAPTTTTTLAPTTTTTTAGTTTTQAPNTCPYSIGNLAEGGVIAYILQSGDPGYDVNQQKGLVATIADISTGSEWGCSGTLISGSDGSAIGTGNQNTIDIMAGCATAGIAARLCGDLVQSGYSDWYLPSKDELNKLYLNKVAIGGFGDINYWSSTEDTSLAAFCQSFFNGNQFVNDKFLNLGVRAIRSFTCPV
jgi:hypothetical protein